MLGNALKSRALSYLRSALGNPQAEFREGQWEAIEAVVRLGQRALIVQRTGWGKSMVYFVATRLLRETGAGPTLLVSPLLSLMRNQMDAAQRLGIKTEWISSANRDEWDNVKSRLLNGEVDILLVSPERLAREDFLSDVLSHVASRVGLFVVDEAHCISDWGHDFRPDYMRIARIMRALPPRTPALATTATASKAVTKDIATQIGSSLRVLRGPLTRRSLRLQNINMPRQESRMAWLAEHLREIPGSGIIYTLTVRDADRLAAWLRHKGLHVEAYHADVPNDQRPVLEQKLLKNEVKALAATTALSMGFDKPDLGFVIHFQRPASVVHYYQQVGRAGRAVDCAYGILMGGEEDDEIAEYFARTALPSAEDQVNVVRAIAEAANGLSAGQILGRVNSSKAQLEKILTLVSVQSPSPITKNDGKYFRTAAGFFPDTKKAARLASLRAREQETMRQYMQTDDCLMEFLARELDDPYAGRCGICASCVGKPLISETYDVRLAAEAGAYLCGDSIVIRPRQNWPPGMPDGSLKGRIPEDLRYQPGRALCIWGDGGWGDAVRRCKQEEGRFSDDLLDAAVELVRDDWSPQPFPEWVTCVPSLARPNLVPDLAGRIADRLHLPFRACLAKLRHTQPQKLMNNSWQQLGNIKDAFGVNGEEVLPGPVLLVDDMVDSRWTFTVLAAILRENRCGEVFPLALANAGLRRTD